MPTLTELKPGPTFASGDMWSAFDAADLFLITTNCVLRGGRLVMGAGIAREARDRFPGLDKALGKAIREQLNPSKYILLLSERWPEAKLGALQTKLHWRNPSSPELVAEGIIAVGKWAKAHPAAAVHMPLPGVGHGHLEVSVVQRLCATLPENVTVWQKA